MAAPRKRNPHFPESSFRSQGQECLWASLAFLSSRGKRSRSQNVYFGLFVWGPCLVVLRADFCSWGLLPAVLGGPCGVLGWLCATHYTLSRPRRSVVTTGSARARCRRSAHCPRLQGIPDITCSEASAVTQGLARARQVLFPGPIPGLHEFSFPPPPEGGSLPGRAQEVHCKGLCVGFARRDPGLIPRTTFPLDTATRGS